LKSEKTSYTRPAANSPFFLAHAGFRKKKKRQTLRQSRKRIFLRPCLCRRLCVGRRHDNENRTNVGSKNGFSGHVPTTWEMDRQQQQHQNIEKPPTPANTRIDGIPANPLSRSAGTIPSRTCVRACVYMCVYVCVSLLLFGRAQKRSARSMTVSV
jgi:hypothetical protein